jgi:hypothetical protein
VRVTRARRLNSIVEVEQVNRGRQPNGRYRNRRQAAKFHYQHHAEADLIAKLPDKLMTFRPGDQPK